MHGPASDGFLRISHLRPCGHQSLRGHPPTNLGGDFPRDYPAGFPLASLKRQPARASPLSAGMGNLLCALPDKEFRYLRTVIVTAAVYWDFNQELAPHHLIFQHRAGVTLYTSTFVFAECCVFIKQSQPPFHCNPITLQEQVSTRYRGAPFPEVTVLICRVPSPEFSQAP